MQVFGLASNFPFGEIGASKLQMQIQVQVQVQMQMQMQTWMYSPNPPVSWHL